MPNFDQHPAGNFVWFELSTTDQSAAKQFYSSLLGWQSEDMPMGPDMIYTMFRLNGRDTAGAYIMKAEERQMGIPPNWLMYISVESADATVATIIEHGGNPMSPAFDIPNVGRMAVIQDPAGAVGLYIYGITGKIGVLMSFTGKPSEDLIKQLGGHIAFARPIGLNRESVPAELVAKEKEIAVEQAKATGKPQQIAEKIAEGKLNSFFAERVLLDQEFFNAQVFKGSISNYLKQNGLTLEKYVRLEVGQA